MNTATTPRLDDLPLWRLIVALDDAERVAGPNSPSAHVLAQAIQKRLRAPRQRTASEEAARDD